MYAQETLPVVAKAVADFVAQPPDPRTAMHFYCLDLDQGAFTGRKPKPGIAIFVYDANGEEHGRSDVGFTWALDIEGAVDETTSMTYRGGKRRVWSVTQTVCSKQRLILQKTTSKQRWG
jgi:hypothetical protein